MAGLAHAAGPEWAYLAPYTTRQRGPVQLEPLFVSVAVNRRDAQPDTKILSMHSLTMNTGLYYPPNDVTRFSLARLRELTSSDDLDIFFQAYDSGNAAPGVAIPDESSFRRLLFAVLHLGLPTATAAGTDRIYIDAPMLRFTARSKPRVEEAPAEDSAPKGLAAAVGLVVFYVLSGWLTHGLEIDYPINYIYSLLCAGSLVFAMKV